MLPNGRYLMSGRNATKEAVKMEIPNSRTELKKLAVSKGVLEDQRGKWVELTR
jgi:uncharacterized protein YpmB